MKKIIAAFTLGTVAITGSVASAQPLEQSQVTIQFDDLDLATKEGVQTLEKRIAATAREFCSFTSARTGSRVKSQAAARCVADFKAKAKNQFAAVIEQQRRGG